MFGRLVQCRTGHAYAGEFRRQFFPEESVDCACGEDLQTCEHIPRTCTRYTSHRGSLQDENRKIALLELRGTPQRNCLLQDSDAFTFTGENFIPKNTPPFMNQTRVAQYTYRLIKSYFVCIAHLEKFLLGSTSTPTMMVNLMRSGSRQTDAQGTVFSQTHVA